MGHQGLIVFGALLALQAIHFADCLYSAGDHVVDLTPSNFDREVKQGSHPVYLVEFYAPWCGHCQALTPEYKKAAAALKGIAGVGAVNADEHKSLGGQYGVRGFPTLKIFIAGQSSPVDYNGGRTASAMVDAVMAQVTKVAKSRLSGGGSHNSGNGGSGGDDSSAGFESKSVVQLTDTNFEKKVIDSDDLWVIAFHAPWCGHCKRLAPEWAKAASELKGKVKIGAVDATAQTVLASRFQIQGYPTIKWFSAGKKHGSWSEAANEYDGGRTASDIVNWAMEKAVESIPPPEVVELTGQQQFDEACKEHPLCVISALPVLYDCQSECRNKYLEVLRDQAAKYKKQMWGWLWTEAGAHPELEKALNLGGAGYPAMLILSQKKMKYSSLLGSFGAAGISEFLRDVSYGQGSVSSQSVLGDSLPSISTRSKWDGKDKALNVDDGFDDDELPDLEPMENMWGNNDEL